MNINRGEWAVFWFTIAYVGVFTAWFFAQGNFEFIWYVITMVGIIALVARNLRIAEFSPALLWSLSLWGLAHMAGGGVQVGEGVLYSLVVLPVAVNGELTVLKYDQLVHAYGFGVTAWMLWHILATHFPPLRNSRSIYVYPALGAMGLGTVNEIIEFIAVLVIPDTNVGGYYNTALDLVFNASGAVIAMILIAMINRRQGA
ncbi:MAG: hypothetical protein CL814_06115 [Confluentimicrobium sp.]|jgi:putative membrane protein|uniref:hypothetical protein n=1 Tax=Actibacterium sp. TaxID=1872125 RepID=UPI00050DDCDE|nr:hypothetical protein [Actibacterium sp.]KGB81627.1 hypothetical protein JT55_12095 [Rhodovulum sp. NI22]MBC56495.1 hypothetical protein [Actibacterium sp.]MDY6857717.1 hypothetical protein [Pseudomonadota bacterium]|tara:strand:+ start:274 stop:876 length:603 start_codon:yes stop_codon:yes gene_type:complete